MNRTYAKNKTSFLCKAQSIFKSSFSNKNIQHFEPFNHLQLFGNFNVNNLPMVVSTQKIVKLTPRQVLQSPTDQLGERY